MLSSCVLSAAADDSEGAAVVSDVDADAPQAANETASTPARLSPDNLCNFFIFSSCMLFFTSFPFTVHSAFITIQTNINSVAVASLTEAGCIVICDGFTLDENARVKAEEENISVITSEMSAYEIAKLI